MNKQIWPWVGLRSAQNHTVISLPAFLRPAFLRPAFLLAALILLAGCGGLGSEKLDPVEVRFAYLDQAADYQPLAELFHQEHPNITVVLEPIALDGDAYNTLRERASEMDAVRVPTLSADDDLLRQFLALDSMVSTDALISRESFYNGALDGLQLDGKQIGLPAGISPYVVFYQPEKLAAAGMAVPPPTWTLDDFVTTALAVHNIDETQINTGRFAYGFCSHYSMPDLLMFTYLFGGGAFDINFLDITPSLNRPENVQAVAWYASLANDFGLMPKGRPGAWVERFLMSGRCAFWLDFLEGSIYGRPVSATAQMLPLPSYVNAFNIATEDGYFVLASSQHPEEAYQWIRFLAEQPGAPGKQIAALKSIVESEAYAQFVSPEVLAIARSLPEQTVILGLETYRDRAFTQSMELFSAAVGRVIDDGVDPQAALDEAQRLAEQGAQ